MALKIVIGTKSGKAYQKELSGEEAEALYGRVLGEEFDGSVIGLSGAKLLITGGSDASGFPMRKDVSGTKKRKILVAKSLGFRGKLRGKRFGGLRIKKMVAGNTVFDRTNQLNLKAISGDSAIEKAFAPAVEEAPAQEAEAPKTEE